MSSTQYQILLDFYHEFPDEFARLSDKTLDAFYSILYRKD